MPSRSLRWIRTGLVIFAAATAVASVVYLLITAFTTGLDMADKVGSCISAVASLAALAVAYRSRPSTPGDAPVNDIDVVDNTGDAQASGGGQANAGVITSGSGRPARVRNAGNARADGPGSVASAGAIHRSDGRR